MANNAFIQMMENQRAGIALAELDEQIKALAKSVEESGGAGQLTLTIKLVSNGENLIKSFDDIRTKFPKKKAPASLFFTNTDYSLSRKNNKQPELPFGRADDGANVTPIKSA